MLRANQRGSFDYFLYGVATVSILVFMFLLILTLTNPSEQVKTGTEVVREVDLSDDVRADIPDSWHTYTNPDNQYQFSYPQEWGAVIQSAASGDRLESESYEYRFTSNEATVVKQVNGRGDEQDHEDSLRVYGWFQNDGDAVTLCSTLECTKSTVVDLKDARLFATQTMKDGVELRSLDDADLYLVQIVNTEFGDWPGLTVSTLLDQGVDTSLPLDEIVDVAITDNYVTTELVRQFSDALD